jgi:hypothetical protein
MKGTFTSLLALAQALVASFTTVGWHLRSKITGWSIHTDMRRATAGSRALTISSLLYVLPDEPCYFRLYAPGGGRRSLQFQESTTRSSFIARTKNNPTTPRGISPQERWRFTEGCATTQDEIRTSNRCEHRVDASSKIDVFTPRLAIPVSLHTATSCAD